MLWDALIVAIRAESPGFSKVRELGGLCDSKCTFCRLENGYESRLATSNVANTRSHSDGHTAMTEERSCSVQSMHFSSELVSLK